MGEANSGAHSCYKLTISCYKLAIRVLLTPCASATRQPKRAMPSSIGALVALAANNCTSNNAAEDERTPDAAGTGARARCANGPSARA